MRIIGSSLDTVVVQWRAIGAEVVERLVSILAQARSGYCRFGRHRCAGGAARSRSRSSGRNRKTNLSCAVDRELCCSSSRTS